MKNAYRKNQEGLRRREKETINPEWEKVTRIR